MIGYKVVRYHKSFGNRSVLMYMETPYCYVMGETINQLPDTGPMALFETLDQAISFKKDLPHYDQHTQLLIMKVDYVPSRKNQMWYKKGKEYVSHDLRFCPFGTRLAESLIPIELCEV